jgi:hypothetical protein
MKTRAQWGTKHPTIPDEISILRQVWLGERRWKFNLASVFCVVILRRKGGLISPRRSLKDFRHEVYTKFIKSENCPMNGGMKAEQMGRSVQEVKVLVTIQSWLVLSVFEVKRVPNHSWSLNLKKPRSQETRSE